MDIMFELVRALPDQLAHAWEIAADVSFKPRKFANLVYCGMGGSAIGGDFLAALARDSATIPINVVRNYTLPAWVGKDTLVVAASYSGNTEETLSAYTQAKTKGAQILAMTSGGQLEKLARKDGFTVIKVPGGPSPRAAVGYMTIPALYVLGSTGLFSFSPSQIEEAIEITREQLQGDIQELAQFVLGGIPLIYGSAGITAAAALRWKCQINENAKMLAFSNSYPELNHNEIVGFELPRAQMAQLRVINLVSSLDHPRNSKRVGITSEIMQQNSIKVFDVHAKGYSTLAQLFSLIALGDLLSIRLAEMAGVEPSPIEKIDYLKKSMSN